MNVQTIFEYAEDEGIEKGKKIVFQKAIVVFIELKKLTDEQIAQSLDIEIDFVKSIHKDLAMKRAIKLWMQSTD